jgi:hypothetical protein
VPAAKAIVKPPEHLGRCPEPVNVGHADPGSAHCLAA